MHFRCMYSTVHDVAKISARVLMLYLPVCPKVGEIIYSALNNEVAEMDKLSPLTSKLVEIMLVVFSSRRKTGKEIY
jgi:hypothetical protein